MRKSANSQHVPFLLHIQSLTLSPDFRTSHSSLASAHRGYVYRSRNAGLTRKTSKKEKLVISLPRNVFVTGQPQAAPHLVRQSVQRTTFDLLHPRKRLSVFNMKLNLNDVPHTSMAIQSPNSMFQPLRLTHRILRSYSASRRGDRDRQLSPEGVTGKGTSLSRRSSYEESGFGGLAEGRSLGRIGKTGNCLGELAGGRLRGYSRMMKRRMKRGTTSSSARQTSPLPDRPASRPVLNYGSCPCLSYMSEVVISDVEKGLKDIFRSLYITNCEIEGEEVTSEDEKTLAELDSYEVLENMKDLMQDLLNSKRELKKTDKSELVSRCEQFEAMLQKLEADVRVHIRVIPTQIEQQLKLHVEAAQGRIDDLQRIAEVHNIEELVTALREKEKELEIYRRSSPGGEGSSMTEASIQGVTHHRILSLEQPLPDLSRPAKVSSETNLQKLIEVADRRHKALLRLEKEIIHLKSALEAKTSELDQLKANYDLLQRENLAWKTDELSRKRSEERVLEKVRIGSKIRASPDRALTDRMVSKRQTEAEWVIRKVANYSPYRKVEHSRNYSKSKLDVSPVPCQPDLRALHHSRTTSERIAKVSPSLRGQPRVS